MKTRYKIIIMATISFITIGFFSFFGCKKQENQNFYVQTLPTLSHQMSATFDDSIEFLGSNYSRTSLRRGEKIEAALYFRALKNIERDYMLFVHHTQIGSRANVFGADHWPVSKDYKTSEWKIKEVLKDNYSILIPEDYSDNEIEIYIGFYEGQSRLKLNSKQHNSKDQRLHIATIKIENPRFPIPKAFAVYTSEPMTLDGKMFENVWKKSRPVTLTDSKDNSQYHSLTQVRFAWNDSGLFLGWEVHDNDIRAKYMKQDDPLYEEEAIEFFINSDGDTNDYTEFQCAPNEIRFDASFTSQRRGMNVSHDSKFVCKTSAQGSVNDENDTDTLWSSEWFIPYQGIKDFSQLPKNQTQWNINLFRIDGFMKDNTLKKKYMAWSLPLIGDFHNLRRFGILEFQKEWL